MFNILLLPPYWFYLGFHTFRSFSPFYTFGTGITLSGQEWLPPTGFTGVSPLFGTDLSAHFCSFLTVLINFINSQRGRRAPCSEGILPKNSSQTRLIMNISQQRTALRRASLCPVSPKEQLSDAPRYASQPHQRTALRRASLCPFLPKTEV